MHTHFDLVSVTDVTACSAAACRRFLEIGCQTLETIATTCNDDFIVEILMMDLRVADDIIKIKQLVDDTVR